MLIAIDFETHLISPEAPFPKPVCLSYYDGKDSGLLIGGDMQSFLSEHLGSSHIIAHNAVFECGVIYFQMPDLREHLWQALDNGQMICTQIIEQLIAIRDGAGFQKVSLADLVKKYFKQDISAGKKSPDAWRLRYNELDGVALADWPQEAKEYAISDSIWAHQLYKQQYTVDHKRAVKAAVALNLMGSLGMHVDVDRVKTLEAEIYAKLEPIYNKLINLDYCSKIGFQKRPKNNQKKLRELVKSTVQEPLVSAKGNIKISKEALLAYYKETNNEIFNDFINITLYDKILTGYINNLKNPLVRSQYSTTKNTGRTSSRGTSIYPSVNIQQMPRKVEGVTWDIRNCFVPTKGFKIVSIDYSGLELASAAHQLFLTFGHSKMRNLLNSGDKPADMHSMLAANIMSRKKRTIVSYEDFLKNKKEKEYAEFRQLCKAINLGFPGGIGYDTMRHILLQNGIRTKYHILEKAPTKYHLWSNYRSLRAEGEDVRIERTNKFEYALVYDELVGLKEELFKTYPELALFLRETHKKALTGKVKKIKNEFDEWEEEPMYRYKVGDFYRSDCVYTAFCNGFLMQTPSAVGATNMAYECIRRYLNHAQVRPLAFIHDEMVLEIRDDQDLKGHVKDISELMIDKMQESLNSVRISVEAEVMPYWMKSGGDYSVTYWKNPGEKQLCYEE